MCFLNRKPKSRDVQSAKVSCEGCGLEGDIVPAVGNTDITVNGALSASEKCPSCSNSMKSESGNYTFEKGKLIQPE